MSDLVGLEPNRAVDEAVLVGAGEVPERDVCGVLERGAVDSAEGLRKQPRLRGPAAMEFLHRVDRLAEVLMRVMRPTWRTVWRAHRHSTSDERLSAVL